MWTNDDKQLELMAEAVAAYLAKQDPSWHITTDQWLDIEVLSTKTVRGIYVSLPEEIGEPATLYTMDNGHYKHGFHVEYSCVLGYPADPEFLSKVVSGIKYVEHRYPATGLLVVLPESR